jgi:hypothetical protein
MIPSYRKADTFPKTPVTGYDYAKQIEAEKAPLTSRDRLELLVFLSLAIALALASYFVPAHHCSVATCQWPRDRLASWAIAIFAMLPLRYFHMRKQRGVTAATNQPLQ